MISIKNVSHYYGKSQSLDCVNLEIKDGIAMAIGYMIYRRSFKLKILDFIMIALVCVMMFATYPIR